MQKIFIVIQEFKSEDKNGNLSRVNEFIRDGGHIISVTHQHVAVGAESTIQRGRWLVVADDGRPKKEEELLP